MGTLLGGLTPPPCPRPKISPEVEHFTKSRLHYVPSACFPAKLDSDNMTTSGRISIACLGWLRLPKQLLWVRCCHRIT